MNPGKVEWNEENKPQPDMELLEQWISRQEDQMREDIAEKLIPFFSANKWLM